MTEVCSALEAWATSHDIGDGWMFDAAVQTLVEWSRLKQETGWVSMEENGWVYRPQELDTPVFNPSFGSMWLPLLPMRWSEFKKEMDKSYLEQLQKYRKTVAPLWGADRKKLSEQAIWTVLWQRGKSVGQIRLWEGRKHGRKPSEANIQRRVNKFAASIGLTLRPAIHGPQKKT